MAIQKFKTKGREKTQAGGFSAGQRHVDSHAVNEGRRGVGANATTIHRSCHDKHEYCQRRVETLMNAGSADLIAMWARDGVASMAANAGRFDRR